MICSRVPRTKRRGRGSFRLIKNCRDSQNHIYGAQENYEANIASGWILGVWRCGLVLLFPLAILTWLGFLLLILVVLVYFASASLVYLPLAVVLRRRRQLALMLFGRDRAEGRETGAPLPAWLEQLLLWAARLLSGPLAIGLLVLIRGCAFRRIRRAMTAFLASRPVLAGAGMIDHQQQFHLADKGPAINCVVGYGGYLWDRPIFNFGHFFKAASIEALLAPRDYAYLFARRQRLQIGLGDSNMADVAEFLRVGTTLLVLDAIEAESLSDPPTLCSPIRALHQICADPALTCEVPLVDGRRATAIQLQRSYLRACERFVLSRDDAPEESHEVLRRWAETLDALESDRDSLVGSVDWVTKKFLLDAAGDAATWAERKKIDIRYHELSEEGYFRRLAQIGLCPMLVDSDLIARAVRGAPPNSPATTRGRFIREFAGGDRPVAANWRRVIIGRGRAAVVIHLDRYQRGPQRSDASQRDAPDERLEKRS